MEEIQTNLNKFKYSHLNLTIKCTYTYLVVENNTEVYSIKKKQIIINICSKF